MRFTSTSRAFFPFVFLMGAIAAQAQTWTWDGGGASNGWSQNANWVGDIAPTSGSNTSIVFGTGAHTNVSQNIVSPFRLNQLTFNANANAFRIEGSLDFRSNSTNVTPVITVNSTANQHLGSALTLTNHLLVNGSGTGVLTLGGAISGVGNYTQTYTGGVALTGPASYTGSTTISAGAFNINAGGSLTGGGSLQATGSGIIRMTAGTANVSTVGINGRLEISGGTLTASSSISGISGSSDPIIDQTGGSVQAASLNLNTSADHSTYLLSGADSTLTVTGQLDLSNNGRYTQQSGHFSVGSVRMFSGSRTAILTLNGGSISAGNINVAGGSWVQSGGSLQAASLVSGTSDGTAFTIQMTGGSQNYTNAATFAAASAMSFALSGPSTLTAGGALTFTGDTGTTVTQSGGSISAASISLSSLRGTGATYSLSAGEINTGVFSLDSAAARFTQTGGTATVTNYVVNHATNEVNLNGGTLKLQRIGAPAGSTLGTLNFNGGTLEARRDQTTFISGLTSLNVQEGGARIDSGGFFIETAQAFVHGTGGAIDGGLTKLGTGRLTLTGENTYTGTTTISAGTLQIGNGGTTGSLGVGDVVNHGTLIFRRTGTLTIPSLSGTGTVTLESGFTLDLANASGSNAVTGAGTLVKSGTGRQTLGDLSNFTGTLSVNGGTLAITNLGAGPIVNLAGSTLEFAGNSSTSRSFTLASGGLNAASGVKITYAGSAIVGGFLRGAGTHELGHGTSLSGTTSALGSALSHASGTIGMSDVTLRGSFTQGAGATANLTNTVLSASGAMAISGTVNTDGFESLNQITIRSGGLFNNTGLNVALGGGSRTVIEAGGELKTDSFTTIELNGGLLTNNGQLSGKLNVNYGSTARGAGSFGTVVVAVGGAFAPGNSPGTATVDHITFDDGGSYQFELNSTVVDLGKKQDFLSVRGALAITASAQEPFTISLRTLNSGHAPAALADFNSSVGYEFVIAEASSISGFDRSNFNIDTTGFLNGLDGGTFDLHQSDDRLILQFTPVPEPSSMVLGWMGMLVFAVSRRKR